MIKKIKEALNSISIPSYYLIRDGTEEECIVYSYISNPQEYADNAIRNTKYTILINIYVKNNVENIKKEVLNSMRLNGFLGGNVQNTMPIYRDNQLIEFNTAIKFVGYMKS